MARAREPTDRGLARERTVLAWNRSGLAVVVCVAVLLRRVWPLAGAGRELAMALVAAAAIVWAFALLAVTASGARGDEETLLRPSLFRLMTAGTLLLAVVAVVLAFFAPA